MECTNTGCTAGVGRAPFKTPALTPDDALAYLGLHRESAHGNYAKDAEENTERINCPNHTSPEVEQAQAHSLHSHERSNCQQKHQGSPTQRKIGVWRGTMRLNKILLMTRKRA